MQKANFLPKVFIANTQKCPNEGDFFPSEAIAVAGRDFNAVWPLVCSNG